MNRRLTVATIVVAGLFATVGLAQKRPYDQVMKDVNGTFASLKKNLDAKSSAAAAEDAAKLEALFKETETFWTQFETKDAMDNAKGASSAFANIGAALKDNNIEKAQAGYAGTGKYCKSCHDTHREQLANKSYVIKP